ncbi:MAG: serine hydrolase, partial [Bacillota bacterium]
TQDSLWYWASAGKTLTAFLIGKAQEEKLLSISEASSKYLGLGWTNAPKEKEDKITIRHQLTMTSGLDDGVPDNHCTAKSCLIYLADAGTRWAYHNAPYNLLEQVIEKASGQSINTYTALKLKSTIGLTGAWSTVDYDNVFFSKPRSMARYGLLALNNFVWDSQPVLNDKQYIHDMINSSQQLNMSYGYLWWLNGKTGYMLPTLQTVFSGSYAPQAPADMFAGLGKNGQILSVSPSKGIVIVRMGNQPNSPASDVSTLFCNQIWTALNAAIDDATGVGKTNTAPENFSLAQNYPNPFNPVTIINYQISGYSHVSLKVFDVLGREVATLVDEYKQPGLYSSQFSIVNYELPSGVYFYQLKTGNFVETKKMMVVK